MPVDVSAFDPVLCHVPQKAVDDDSSVWAPIAHVKDWGISWLQAPDVRLA